jgi:hypothetical protein
MPVTLVGRKILALQQTNMVSQTCIEFVFSYDFTKRLLFFFAVYIGNSKARIGSSSVIARLLCLTRLQRLVLDVPH